MIMNYMQTHLLVDATTNYYGHHKGTPPAHGAVGREYKKRGTEKEVEVELKST